MNEQIEREKKTKELFSLEVNVLREKVHEFEKKRQESVKESMAQNQKLLAFIGEKDEKLVEINSLKEIVKEL